MKRNETPDSASAKSAAKGERNMGWPLHCPFCRRWSAPSLGPEHGFLNARQKHSMHCPCPQQQVAPNRLWGLSAPARMFKHRLF